MPEHKGRMESGADGPSVTGPVTGPEVMRRSGRRRSTRRWWRTPKALAGAAALLVGALVITVLALTSDRDDVDPVDGRSAVPSVVDGVPRSVGHVTVDDYGHARRARSIEPPPPDGPLAAADQYATAVAAGGVDPRAALQPGSPASAAAWRQKRAGPSSRRAGSPSGHRRAPG